MKRIDNSLDFKQNYLYNIVFADEEELVVLCLENNSEKAKTLVNFKTLKGQRVGSVWQLLSLHTDEVFFMKWGIWKNFLNIFYR